MKFELIPMKDEGVARYSEVHQPFNLNGYLYNSRVANPEEIDEDALHPELMPPVADNGLFAQSGKIIIIGISDFSPKRP